MKEFVEKLIETFKCEELRTELIAVGDVISIINQLAEEHSNVPDTNVGKWIPCSERLPEYGKKVLVYCEVDNKAYIVSREMTVFEEDVWENENFEYEDIDDYVAWMPLPKPYEPEEQKKIPTDHFAERFNRVM